MNTRLPYYPLTPSNSNYHTNYTPVHNWNDIRTETLPLPTSPTNWDRNSRNGWKRTRNWTPTYNNRESTPYNVPKKPYTPRYPQARFDNTSNFYENNSHSPNWTPNYKPKQITENKDREKCIPGVVASKKKRKPMSKSYPSAKWDEKDAEKALQAEKDFTKNLKSQSLIIKFPDPELNKDIVKQFHPAIENVHFPQASTPRYCFAHLEENTDIDLVVSTLEKIRFGQGYLSVELKKAREENREESSKDIDPYTLYVGNLPLNVTKGGVIQCFQGCTRIDIGHPQQMKNTRYAFVRFSNVDDAIAAYRSTRNTLYESRSMIVRFRRINGNVGVPGESKQPNPSKPKTEVVQKASPSSPKPDISKDKPFKINESPLSKSSSSIPPDLSLVKEEPTSDAEEEPYDVKPELESEETGPLRPVKTEPEIKKEPNTYYRTNRYNRNEDDIEDEDEDDDFDANNDHFLFNGGAMEDECDDYEDDDDFDVNDDDMGMELDAADTFLPGDDDDEIFNGQNH